MCFTVLHNGTLRLRWNGEPFVQPIPIQPDQSEVNQLFMENLRSYGFSILVIILEIYIRVRLLKYTFYIIPNIRFLYYYVCIIINRSMQIFPKWIIIHLVRDNIKNIISFK